jgi:uncharacterized membrane protein
MQWFDNTWNNSAWILTGMIAMLILQLVMIGLWEYYLRPWWEAQTDRLHISMKLS